MIHNPVKNRTQRESIVPTERGGETDDGYMVLRRSDLQIHNPIPNIVDSVRILDARVEVRKDTEIGRCSGVVCLVDDNGFQPCRIKLLQSRSAEQCLVCRDGSRNPSYQCQQEDGVNTTHTSASPEAV